MKRHRLTRQRIGWAANLLGLWLLGLAEAKGLEYPMPEPGDDLVGALQSAQTRYEDTLSDIARLYDVGYREIIQANPAVDPWLPGEGTGVLIPTRFILPPGPREGIVINLAELRLYYYPPDGQRVLTYPLGIGREGWNTPTGRTRIIRKQIDPSWWPPASIRAEQAKQGNLLPDRIPPGPDNPLGKFALYLQLPGYLLHGTNRPYGVGMRVSHGCIRLYPEDIAHLFEQVPRDTPVRIINQPQKAGWYQGQLFVEVHPPLREQQAELGNQLTPLIKQLVRRLGNQHPAPDWELVHKSLQQARGIPLAVTRTKGDAGDTEVATNQPTSGQTRR